MQSTQRYADPDYPGKGKLLCYNCDRPTTEHPISRPCPFPRVKNQRTPKKQVHWPAKEPQGEVVLGGTRFVVVED